MHRTNPIPEFRDVAHIILIEVKGFAGITAENVKIIAKKRSNYIEIDDIVIHWPLE